MAGLRVGAVLTLRDELTAKLDRARASAGRFVDQIGSGVSKLSNFSGAGAKVGSWVDSFHGKLTNINNGGLGNFVHNVANAGQKMLDTFGSKASAMVTDFFGKLKLAAGLGVAAIGAIGFKAAESSMDFEAAIRHATGLLVAQGATSEEADAAYKQFADTILSTAPELAKAPVDLANSLYLPLSVMAQAGQVNTSVADSLKIVAAASKAATAGFADSTVVTTALSRVMGAYSASADEATHYTDIMQQAVNYGLMTFSDLAQGIGMVAGPAAALKIPFDQVAAAIATITRRGIVPDEAFTALNKFMLAIEKPHPEAIANLEAMFGPDWQSHFSATALAAKGLGGVIDDLIGKVKPTKDQLAELNQATQFGSDEDIRNAGAAILGDRVDQLIGIIGDVRGLRGVLSLTAEGGGTSFAQALDLTGNSAGAVQKQFDEYRKTTQYAKDEFSSFMDVVKENLLSGVLPSLGDAFHSASDNLAELMSTPEWKEGDLATRIKLLGGLIGKGLGTLWEELKPKIADGAQVLWSGLVSWWEEHNTEVQDKVNEFFDWLGTTALPWAVSAGVQLGGAIVQGLWTFIKGAATTPVGLAIGALMLTQAPRAVESILGKLGVNLGKSVATGAEASGMEAAAAGLSGAATELSAAAAALMEAAGAEGAGGLAGGAGAAGAAGAATAGEEVAAGGFLSTLTVGSVASFAILGAVTIASVVATVWAWQDANAGVEAGNKNLDSKVGLAGAAAHQQQESTGTPDFNQLGQGSQAIGGKSAMDVASQIVFPSYNPWEQISVPTVGIVKDTVDKAVGLHDQGMIDKLKNAIVDSHIVAGMEPSAVEAMSQLIQEGQQKLATEDQLNLVHAFMQNPNVHKLGGTDLPDDMAAREKFFNNLKGEVLSGDQNVSALGKSILQPLYDDAAKQNYLTQQTKGDLATSLMLATQQYNMLGDTDPVIKALYGKQIASLQEALNWATLLDAVMKNIPPPSSPLNGLDSSNFHIETDPDGTQHIVPGGTPGAAAPAAPGSTGPPPPPPSPPTKRYHNVMADGGFGTLHRPTGFLGGEAGTEDYAFAPHRSIGGFSGLVQDGTEAALESFHARIAATPAGGAGNVDRSMTFRGPLIAHADISNELDIETVADKLAEEIEKRVNNGEPAVF